MKATKHTPPEFPIDEQLCTSYGDAGFLLEVADQIRGDSGQKQDPHRPIKSSVTEHTETESPLESPEKRHVPI